MDIKYILIIYGSMVAMPCYTFCLLSKWPEQFSCVVDAFVFPISIASIVQLNTFLAGNGKESLKCNSFCVLSQYQQYILYCIYADSVCSAFNCYQSFIQEEQQQKKLIRSTKHVFTTMKFVDFDPVDDKSSIWNHRSR